MRDDEPAVPRLFVPALVFELGLGVLALALGLIFGVEPLATLRVDLQGLTAGTVATLPLLVVFAVTWKHPVGPFRAIREMIDRYLVPGLSDCSSAELALLALSAGLGEELLFRGLVQGALSAWTGEIAALVIASIVFGAGHAVTRGYAVLAGVMGLWLGGLWLWTGNLAAPMACHALYDYVALEVFVRDARRRA